MPNYDLVIKNGRVMDPASDFEGAYNIGVIDGAITTLTLQEIAGAKEIDARGLVVAPGFVDIHTHVDGLYGGGELMARWGVTTAIGGSCGSLTALARQERDALIHSEDDSRNDVEGTEDLESLFRRIDAGGYPVNLGMLVPATSLRMRVGAKDRLAPADDQVPHMVELAEADMSQGAFGVSFGLAYVPGTSQKELVELFNVAARHDGIAAIHPRYFAAGLPGFALDAIAGQMELIEAARLTGVKLQIAHIAHQLAFKTRSYGSIVERGLQVIEQAQSEGLDVMADCLPIAFNGAAISEPFMDIVLSPSVEKHYGVKPEDVLEVVDGPYKGVRLTRERFAQIRKEAPNTPLHIHLMREDLMIRTLLPPYVMVSSDAADNGIPAQLIVLGRMVRELGVLTLMQALYKLSTLPALRLGLERKGRIAVGADADLVVFDPETVQGIVRSPKPSEIEGVKHVVVNGVPVVEKEKLLQDVLPGKALRYQPWQ